MLPLRFILPLLLIPLAASAASAEEGFTPLFNGTDLSGWEGDPKRWSVENGLVIGRSRADDPLKANTFLIWKGGNVRDFELRLSFRFPPAADGKPTANSGVQYRSRVVDPAIWSVGGYQADMDAAGRYVGMLYEELGRGIVCRPGEQVRLDVGPDGKARSVVLGATVPPAALASAYRPGEWNDLVIIARGRNLTHRINGVITAEVRDEDDARGAEAGVLALQLHRGPPMEVQFRDVRMRAIVRGERSALGPRPPGPLEGSALKIAAGFRVERLSTVPRETQGSWVCLSVDPQG